ncbi:MAG: hypothetical protein ACXWW0_08220, partial [Bacteroidia bacterium]
EKCFGFIAEAFFVWKRIWELFTFRQANVQRKLSQLFSVAALVIFNYYMYHFAKDLKNVKNPRYLL